MLAPLLLIALGFHSVVHCRPEGPDWDLGFTVPLTDEVRQRWNLTSDSWFLTAHSTILNQDFLGEMFVNDVWNESLWMQRNVHFPKFEPSEKLEFSSFNRVYIFKSIHFILHAFGLILLIVSICFLVYFIAFVAKNLVFRQRNPVPDFRTNFLNSIAATKKDELEQLRQQTLADLRTVWQSLQTSGQGDFGPVYESAFARLYAHFLPETGQSVQDAFPEDFPPQPPANQKEWMKLILEGSAPQYRYTILTVDERKKAETPKREDRGDR